MQGRGYDRGSEGGLDLSSHSKLDAGLICKPMKPMNQ